MRRRRRNYRIQRVAPQHRSLERVRRVPAEGILRRCRGNRWNEHMVKMRQPSAKRGANTFCVQAAQVTYRSRTGHVQVTWRGERKVAVASKLIISTRCSRNNISMPWSTSNSPVGSGWSMYRQRLLVSGLESRCWSHAVSSHVVWSWLELVGVGW